MRRLGRALADEAFGFTVLDAVWLTGLYAVGNYFIVDTPINIAVALTFGYLFGSTRRSVRRVALFVLCWTTGLMVLSGVAAACVPRASALSLPLRGFHQIGSRFVLLMVLPYLVLHVRTDVSRHPPRFRWVARVAWLLLKCSLWVGAFVALLSIKGKIIPFHVAFLLAAVPLLLVHVSWAPMRPAASGDRPNVAPFRIGEVGSPGLYLLAGLAAVSAVGAVAWIGYQARHGHGLTADPDYMIEAHGARFEPSPSHTDGDVYYRRELLARSTTCGSADCHPALFGEWRASAHVATAGDRYRPMAEEVARTEGVIGVRVCAGCHDPISLFSGAIRPGGDVVTAESIREGLSCFACHGLRARPEVLANGALGFVFPDFYYREPPALTVMVGTWREHRADFLGPSRDPNALCVTCHRFEPLADSRWSSLDQRWLRTDFHAQRSMTDACRGTAGCIDCHMPPVTPPEKPGPMLRSHRFAAVASSTVGRHSAPGAKRY